MKPIASYLCLGGLALLGGIAAAASPPSGHAVHPPMPGQEYSVQCRIETSDKPVAAEAPLKLASPTMATALDQAVELPAPLAPLKLKRYLPRAKLKQELLPDESRKSPPAIQIAVEGPKQSYQAWLIANDPERNRLVSLIGTWRYMVVDNPRQRDELFAQFEKELTREPTIIISRGKDGVRCELPLKIGEQQTAGDLGCKVRVRSFFGHFAMDDKSGKPVNASDKRLNPAALVEIEHDAGKEERWLFAKFPDFAKDKTSSNRYQVVLDCPIDKTRESPDFAIVTIGGSTHETWLRSKGKTTFRPAKPGARFEVPGSQYHFSMTQFVASGRLIEEYVAAETKDAQPALQFEAADASGSSVVAWLGLGKSRVISTTLGPMTVTFGNRQPATAPRHP